MKTELKGAQRRIRETEIKRKKKKSMEEKVESAVTEVKLLAGQPASL